MRSWNAATNRKQDHPTEPAEARWRAIERAILDTDPDTIRDVDLVEMLRLARKIIDNDEYATSGDAAKGMLDLIETTLVRRTEPKDWERAASPRCASQVARLKALVWRLIATRAALRLVRRVCDRLEPNSHRSS